MDDLKNTQDHLKERSAPELTTTVSKAQPSHDFAIGDFISGRYRILALIGKGGMGCVYKAKHLLLDKDCALKTLTANVVSDAAWKRFQKEAQSAALLEHPALVKVHDFGQSDDGQLFFVMDLVEGETISQLIKKNGPLPLDKVLEIFSQVCLGLGYAHSQGVVHRDIKPSNIMVSGFDGSLSELKVKIVDFGIAKILGGLEAEAVTRTGEIFGTPFYMSPEQCLGKAVDDRSDIYSVGCSLFEALTGTPPFMGESALATMMMHQSEEPPSLKEASLGRSFPQGLQEVVSKLLKKDPRDRYQKLVQVARDLARIKANEPVTLGFHAEQDNKPLDQAKFSGRASLLITPIIVISLCGAAFFIGQITAPKPPVPKGMSVQTKQETHSMLRYTDRAAEALDPHGPSQDINQYFSSSTDPKSWRLFHFPPVTLGYIELPKGTKAFRYKQRIPEQDNRPSATGELLVQNFAPLTLNVNRILGADYVQLRHFRPDEIGALDFKKTTGILDVWLANITSLKSIKSLSLRSADALTDGCVDSLNQLPQLESLYIGRSKLSAQALLKINRLRALTSFGLEHCNDTRTILPGLSSALTHLYLKNCAMDQASLERIRRMSNLSKLEISGAPNLTDDDLKRLSSLQRLRWLNIADCDRITVKGLRALRALPIKSLFVANSQFSADDLAEIGKIFPKCMIGKLKPHDSSLMLLKKFMD